MFVASRHPIRQVNRAASLALLARSSASVPPVGQPPMLRWKSSTTKATKAAMKNYCLEKLTAPDILWGWNVPASHLLVLNDPEGDQKLTPDEQATKRLLLRNLEESRRIAAQCAALRDDESCLHSRRAAEEPMHALHLNVRGVLRKAAGSLRKIKMHLHNSGGRKSRVTDVRNKDADAAEEDNLALLKVLLAAVQARAYGEAFEVFLRDMQEAAAAEGGGRPDLLRKVVVPLVAPRLKDNDSLADIERKVAGLTAATAPRLDNGALWLARLSRHPLLASPYRRAHFDVRPGEDQNRPPLLQIAGDVVLAHRPDLARAVGWALAAERIKCEIHLAGVQRFITEWDKQLSLAFVPELEGEPTKYEKADWARRKRKQRIMLQILGKARKVPNKKSKGE
ncbi:hypothetical protein PG997_014336 [Apiospora hydei]|uniref:Uncharacterized protein n=1 Tax=Apiospora hydei TaxID=1337664 RepID=A0ABR1UWM7_9PEZI